MRHVHLVGSVPLKNAREVFETVCAALGPKLKRVPDGETGERSDWITKRFIVASPPVHAL